MNHRQARQLFPGYVLGALEAAELEELLQHFRSCGGCYQLVQGAMEVGAMLASTIYEADPPISLKARVQDSLDAISTSNNK